MKPLAVFYAAQVAKSVALYFSLVSDFPKNVDFTDEDDDQLPIPFKLGPYLFGKNRVSILTFGRVEIRVRRFRDALDFERSGMPCPNEGPLGSETTNLVEQVPTSTNAERKLRRSSGEAARDHSPPVSRKSFDETEWYFEVSNGKECIMLNAHSPFVLFSVLENSFEAISTSRQSRLAQIADLALLAGDCMTKLDPALHWITDSEIRHHILYQYSSTHLKMSTSEIMVFLAPMRQCFTQMLQHDPEARSEGGVFDDVLTRSRVTFAILSECALYLYQRGYPKPDASRVRELAVVCEPQLRPSGVEGYGAAEMNHGRLQVKNSTDLDGSDRDWETTYHPSTSRLDVPSLFLSKPRGVGIEKRSTDGYDPSNDEEESMSAEVSMCGDVPIDGSVYQSRGEFLYHKSWQLTLVRTVSMFSPYSEATTSGSSKPKGMDNARKLFQLDSIDREQTAELNLTFDQSDEM